jgi:DNA-binding LytR/AlgR family response regulator
MENLSLLRCLIVDDEPFALQLMRDDLRRLPQLELVGAASSVQEAEAILKTKNVDVMFLDIQMPGITGIQFLRSLEHPPLVILTTAYDQYAVESYELNVVDYLVKPIPFERLEKSVQKAKERLHTPAPEDALRSSFFFVRSEYKEIKIHFSDIQYVEGLKDYVKIFLTSQPRPVLTRMNLKAMDQKLPPDQFCRIHNSFIVPLARITAVQRSQVFLGTTPIPVGDKFSAEFRRKYGSEA